MPSKKNTFAKRIIAWHQHHGRHHLPWQHNKDPYRVWISEIMLQQTQVSTVIPYFLKFIEKFSDVHHLAHAPLDDVLALWSGLGYYSRARNLWKTAKMIVENFGGALPCDLALLQTLPGIGRSTAAAILSLAFEQPATILDGNVKRVLARFFALNISPAMPKYETLLWEHAENLTPKKNNATYTQAMMDLGANICTRTKPRCHHCPLQEDCLAYAENNPTHYPLPRKKIKIPTEKTYFLAIQNPVQKFFLLKRPSPGIWGDLWCLPQFENLSDLKKFVTLSAGKLNTTPEHLLHTFTHKRWEMHIYPMQTVSTQIIKKHLDGAWVTRKTLLEWGLPAPIRQWFLAQPEEHS